MDKDLEFLINLVKNASQLINDQFIVKAKDDKGDLVTNFDYEIEKYIIEKIKENYPDFSIVSEEYNSEEGLTDNCFTIDPIDGTINFANNIPLWGIQVACIKDRKTCAAVIYLPKLNELYYADQSGAFLNGDKIFVNNLDINRGLYTIDGPGKSVGQLKMKDISPHCRDLYCAAVNFAWVASGRLSATNFVWDTLWDYIPGQFIVEKAGGVIYNDTKKHIAANNNKFLEIMKNNS
ncbi:MAG: inositol monophosphatase [Bacilli bacterium]|nr:inositol monophosphatase [Bacilli bacterium]